MIEELARLTELLRATPGLTAIELRDALRREGRVSITAADVFHTLTSAPHVFRRMPGYEGSWYAPDEPVTQAERAVESVVPPLYRWQTAALAAWRAAASRGVIEAVTGTGKTVVGLVAARAELATGGQVAVVVPTRELLVQWLAALRPVVPRGTSIGLLGDGHRDGLGHHDVVIAVVNSARDADLSPRRPGGLLIADECHRYASDENRRALVDAFPRRLGLSATFARPDDGHLEWLAPYFGATCYRLGYEEAHLDSVIAPLDVVLIGLTCSVGERAIYDERSKVMATAAATLIGRFGVPTEPHGAFLRGVSALVHGDGPGAAVACRFLSAMQERRRVLDGADSKFELLGRLAPAVAQAGRTLVFTSSIVAAERSAAVLVSHGLDAEAVHSDQPSALRRTRMESFRDGRLRVLVAPQVLDEGIDVADADLGVVLGTSRSRRQMVQRVGRVLRCKTDGRRARFVVGYIRNTFEDPAHGAHGSFLEDVTTVARRVETYLPDLDGWDQLVESLSPWPGSNRQAAQQRHAAVIETI